ncbi:MAG: hypothetical protein WAW02_11125 [Sideroxyarcus sp.]
MKPDSNSASSHKSCGRCGKTIRMREGLNTLLCTAILGEVDAGFEDVCEHYVERDENAELSFSAGAMMNPEG